MAVMSHDPFFPQVKLRLLFGDRAMVGPGKVLLLENIRDLGSISAAGRAMGMSYKRAWSLVEEMNAAFRLPVVLPARGGAGGGGAAVTGAGLAVIAAYRGFEAAALEAGAGELAALRGMLADMSD
ncbi:winged helix-turn-helix domain-containing protein [Paragemmobacter aquarius]|nr:LysR family transcriptional regulator [Gemmobacter aquarius]